MIRHALLAAAILVAPLPVAGATVFAAPVAWREGGVYRLVTAPEQVADVALQPGENLVSVAAGDTARWVIGDTASGSGAGRRIHVLVKPTASGLRTNLVIATDRRVYHLALESRVSGAMAGIGWTYAEDALIALRAGREEGRPGTVALALEGLNFSYGIRGPRVPWRPLRVFDDGRQTFIEFPPGFGGGEAPPLFAIGAGGAAELVNYRVRGRYYIVDRVLGSAELRLGGRRQQVVRIVRLGPPARRRGE